MKREPFTEQEVFTFPLQLAHVEPWERFATWLLEQFPSTVTKAGVHFTGIFRGKERDGVICVWWQQGGAP